MSLDDDGNPGGVRRPKPPPLGDEIEQMPNPSAGSSLLPKRIDMPVKNTFIQFPALCPSPAPPRDAPHTTPATMASHIASSLRSAAYGLDFFEPIQNVHHPIQHFRNPDPRPSAQTSAGRPQIPFFFAQQELGNDSSNEHPRWPKVSDLPANKYQHDSSNTRNTSRIRPQPSGSIHTQQSYGATSYQYPHDMMRYAGTSMHDQPPFPRPKGVLGVSPPQGKSFDPDYYGYTHHAAMSSSNGYNQYQPVRPQSFAAGYITGRLQPPPPPRELQGGPRYVETQCMGPHDSSSPKMGKRHKKKTNTKSKGVVGSRSIGQSQAVVDVMPTGLAPGEGSVSEPADTDGQSPQPQLQRNCSHWPASVKPPCGPKRPPITRPFVVPAHENS